jgi:hypothetical protein
MILFSKQTSDEKMRQVFSGKHKDWLEVYGKLLCGTFKDVQHLFCPLRRVQLGLECDNRVD